MSDIDRFKQLSDNYGYEAGDAVLQRVCKLRENRFRWAVQAYENLRGGVGRHANVPWAGTGYFNNVQVIVDAYGFNIERGINTICRMGSGRM